MMRKKTSTYFCFFLSLCFLFFSGCGTKKHSPNGSGENIDLQLRKTFSLHKITPIEKIKVSPAKSELGRFLFFDKILSGNRNISCATCHLPQAATSDALPLPVGEGGVGEMTNRIPPKDEDGNFIFVRRHSPDLFNRGHFLTMFWDGRVMEKKGDKFLASFSMSLPEDMQIWTPVRRLLPAGLDNALAAQAMFPPTSQEEMKGYAHGNELGKLEQWERRRIWIKLLNRILDVKEYRELFAKAYPGVPPQDYSFTHAANALASFEIDAFTLTDAPFDRYLKGDTLALNDREKRGALLFYTKANCVSCHSGTLMTDQIFHNRVVPQLGPGRGIKPGGGPDGTWDGGRGGVTGWTEDHYRFRTPPLRNVAKTAPYMHDGAFSTLKAAIQHELDPLTSAQNYDPISQLPERYAHTYRSEQTKRIASFAKPEDIAVIKLNADELDDLLAFLEALTSPQVDTLTEIIPDRVPSGLPIKD